MKLSRLISVFTLFLITSFIGKHTYADHIIGSDISYTCGDTAGIYDITFNFYRDCNGCYVLGQSPRCGTTENCGSSLTAPTSLSVKCLTSGQSTNVNTISMTRQSIIDITPTCRTDKSRCQQPCNGSFPYGIEKHTFTGRVDLRSSISGGCCDFEISVLLYVRNVGITTGQSQQSFYTSCEINACQAPCNSSPTLSNDPVAILCCNQPYSFNNGAVDTADLDSISYSFAPAYRGQNLICNYNGTRTYLNPIATYYPGSLNYPYTNPNATPPIGTYLNPETGDIIFTPVNCTEVAVVVVQMIEWRKDSTGTYKQIGITRRDMQFIVMSCPDNNPPIINGPFSYSVCAGSQICFNVTTNDIVYVPPPPATAPPPDTVKVTWNQGIPGASFTIVNPLARLQTGRFCWTPSLNHAKDLPYTFTVTARDNACPLNAVTVRSFRVKVKHRAEAERDIDTLPCGEYAFESLPITGFRGTPSYRWEILDSNSNIMFNPKIAKFRSTATFLSFQKQDTILFRRGGTYIIKHTINNQPNNCPSIYLDTLVVPPLLEANLSLGPDTFICAGTTLRLEPYVYNATPPINYQWSTMGVTDDGDFQFNVTSNFADTLEFFEIQVPANQVDTAVSIIITDQTGCTSEDTIQVFLKENPQAHLGPDIRLCTYDSTLIIPSYDTAYWVDRILMDTIRQGDTLWKEWYLNGGAIPFSYDDSVTINVRGEYVLKVYDSLGCFDTDTLFLFVNDTVTADAGPDQIHCFDDTVRLAAGGLDTMGNGKSGLYRWYDITSLPRLLLGTNSNYDFPAQTTTEYQLDLYVTEGGVECYDADSILVTVNPLPVIDIKGDKQVCCDYGPISMNFDINSPTGGSWSCWEFPFLVNANTFFTDSACGLINAPATNVRTYVTYGYTDPTTGCYNSDSLQIQVDALPNTYLNETVFCQDAEEVTLKDAVVVSPATYLGTPSWKCLDCNGNDFSNMLVDSGLVAGITDYRLRIGEDYYTLENPDKDTIVLEFTYVNERGCRSKDTVSMQIWRVPTITFSQMDPLCWNDGEVSLNLQSGVNLTDGVWSVVNDTTIGGTTYSNITNLGGLSADSINTFNSNTNGGEYYLRYTHTSTGCPVINDTILIINPLPTITIDPFDRQPPRYCEDMADVPLNVNPTGGTWTSTDPSAIVGGNSFSPGNATVHSSDIWFYYNYTSPSTGCQNVDSISAVVEPLPILSVPNDTVFCRPDGQMALDLNFGINASNHGGVGYYSTDLFGNKDRYTLAGDDQSVDVDIDLITDSAETFRVIVLATGLGSCSDVDDAFDIVVNPIPEADIIPSNPNGCNPVTSDFAVQINNKVNPNTANYAWTMGEGSTSNSPTPTATYTTDGTNNVTLTLTSDKGCVAVFNSSIDVYPLPTADFVPNPNNYTTAALPRFYFTDQSTVPNVLGSTITDHFWDFDDFNNRSGDKSTEKDPSYFYSADTATYHVKLVVTTNYGCKDSFYHPVVVGPDLIVYIPNAFTPDNSGPGQNEGFHAIISGEKTMDLIIFNRWGEIMFQTTEKDKKWDGTYKGLPAQQDVYAYQLKVIALNDKEYTYSGTITLVR